MDQYEPVHDDNPENDPIANAEQAEDEPEDVQEDQNSALLGSEEQDGEELIHGDMLNDYRANERLDTYEADGLDDEPDEVDEAAEMAARARAEDAMDQRDRRGTSRRRLPAAIRAEDDDEEAMREARRRRMEEDEQMLEEEGDVSIKLADMQGKVAGFIHQDSVQNKVVRVFARFLRTYKDDNGEHLYHTRIQEMGKANRQSLEVDYPHIATCDSEDMRTVAVWLPESPRAVLELLDAATREVVLEVFPDYGNIHRDIFTRIARLPMPDTIRGLRNWHLGNLIKVTGVVTKRTGVFPQLQLVWYDCLKCGETCGPFAQTGDENTKPGMCPGCQSKGQNIFAVNQIQTEYRNFQKLTLQEPQGRVPAGRLPRQKEVVLLNDLIDCARPGEEIEVTGIYTSNFDTSLNIKNSFPVFSTAIEANYVSKKEDQFSMYKLTDEDRAEILALQRDRRIAQRIVKSIAPSIYGHEFIKTALALSLFGGQEKSPSHSHRLRGDINILMLGDPGTAKSQFLKYIQNISSRAVYTTGKGASAVGLTAGVRKDPITREWVLEGGALVLADKGICLIDEFDKMNDQDRVSIHEAMEQQSISVSKAGIVTQLQARCAVIAAANPTEGRYDPAKTFSENVALTDPILSRFDVLCVVRDTVDPVQDQRLAEFVVGNHMRSHPHYDAEEHPEQEQEAADPDIIPQDLLRKYVTYAKQSCKPVWNSVDYDRITSVYTRLREEARKTHGMPIAVRHLESMVRMAEAHARMRLGHSVEDRDVDVAIRMLIESFISTQKYSVHKLLQRQFRQFLVAEADFQQVVMHLLGALVREERREKQLTASLEGAPEGEEGTVLEIPVKALEDKANEYGIQGLQWFFTSQQFTGNGFQLDSIKNAIVYAG